MLTHNSVNVNVCVDLGENTIETLVAQINVIFENNNNISTGFPWIDTVLRDMFDDAGAIDEDTIRELIDLLHQPETCAMLIAHLEHGEHYAEFDPYTMDVPIYDFEEYAYETAENMLYSSDNAEFVMRYFDIAAFQRDLEFDFFEVEVTSPFFTSFDVWFSNY